MNWEAIGAIGEVVGALGVILTLLYLAIQIRQNTKSTDKQNLRDATEFLYSSYKPIIEDQQLAEINLRGMVDYDSLDQTEQERFHYSNVMQLQACTTTLGLRGGDDPTLPSVHEILKRRMSKPGYRRWWRVRGSQVVAPDFLELLETYWNDAESESE